MQELFGFSLMEGCYIKMNIKVLFNFF